jgi:hypothetical protein
MGEHTKCKGTGTKDYMLNNITATFFGITYDILTCQQITCMLLRNNYIYNIKFTTWDQLVADIGYILNKC